MEEIFYHAIASTLRGDYRRIGKLKEQFENWEEVFRAAGKEFGDPVRNWEELKKLNIELILLENPSYPALLREISYSPFGIYVLGNPDILNNLSLAVVGTRRATSAGKDLARKFSASIARAGPQIVSGLALGIDAAAHFGCLEAGGKAVAVLGNGLDHFYPRFNEKLGTRIIREGGVVLSEYPPGTPTLPHHFLERNRIVSGLTQGVLVVEAPGESGALVTARFALEQNRDVFVIPGPVTHSNFEGSHQLIRAGAELVTSPDEILAALNVDFDKSTIKPSPEFLRGEEKIIFELLKKSAEPLEIDKIAEMTNLEIQSVSRFVSFLIINKAIKETERGYAA